MGVRRWSFWLKAVCRLFFVVSVFVQSLPFGCTVHDTEGMVKGACARWMGADCEGATSKVGDVAKREKGREERPPTTRQANVVFSSRSSSSAEPSASSVEQSK